MKKGAYPQLCLAVDWQSEMQHFKGQREDLVDHIGRALEGGVDMLLLRDSRSSKDEYCRVACTLQSLCSKFLTRLIIQDHADCFHDVHADGFELRDDVTESAINGTKSATCCRLIGASLSLSTLNTIPEGLSYINFGPVFDNDSMPVKGSAIELANATRQHIQQLSNQVAKAHSALLTSAFGGITRRNIAQVVDSNVDMICVSEEVMGSGDPLAAVRGLKRIMQTAYRRRRPTVLESKL